MVGDRAHEELLHAPLDLLRRNLPVGLPSGIFPTKVIEGRVRSVLERLEVVMNPIYGDGHSSEATLLQHFDHPEQFTYLISISALGGFLPGTLRLWKVAGALRDRSGMVLNEKPLVLPPLQATLQRKLEILLAPTFPHLDPSAANIGVGTLVLEQLAEVKMAEEIEMGRNPKESFAEVDEEGDVGEGVGWKMPELDLVIVEKTAQERANWNAQTPLKMPSKYRDFKWRVGGAGIVEGGPPSANLLSRENSVRHQWEDIGVRNLRRPPRECWDGRITRLCWVRLKQFVGVPMD